MALARHIVLALSRDAIIASMHLRFVFLVFLVALLAACQAPDIPPSLIPSIAPSPTATLRPRPTPLPADRFEFPLDPNHFGPYVHNVTGPLNVDTRYGVQNPGLGSAGKCFVEESGKKVPFAELYHAGEDWFKFDARHQVDPGAAKNEPVRAVANGLVTWKQDIGAEGWVITIEHLLADGSKVWSAYWHVAEPTVSFGQIVYRGDVIGKIVDGGLNSHLHWEIRMWGDGSNLFPPTSAGGRGTCNGRIPALGYTWDDLLARTSPNAWGYLDPVRFVKEHQ
jgi:murein DD-endopeptidase MepM/ murein hydrolase activator NlpD